MLDDTIITWHGETVLRDFVTCPGCGRVYGHHRTKYCNNCEECSACHDGRCQEPDLVTITDQVAQVILNKL